MTFEPGRVVISKQGHDKGRLFIVLGQVDDKHVTIVDGDSRKLEKPKKKQTKHLRAKPARCESITDALTQGRQLYNSDIRKALRAFTAGEEPIAACKQKEECAFVQE